MEVGKGYKQTDVGVIPEDWDVSPLGKQLRKIPSYGINAPAIPFDFRFPTYLRITDIDEDGRFTESTKASVNHSMSSSYLIEYGDLVFARTGASVGKSYLYNPKDGQLVYAGFLIRVSPDPKRLVPTFLKYYVQSKTYWNWIKTNSMRSGQPGINGREYASLPIPLPPTLAEQEAIAEALSDADALIESLETLLAKKRQVKQGAMSELLSGKKRLPEFDKKQGYKQTPFGAFPKDWETVPLKEVSSMHGRIGWQGLKQTEFTMNSDEPFLITGMNFKDGEIRWEEVYHISEERYGIAKEIQLKIGDVLMTKDGTIGKILFVDHIPYPGKASLNSHLLVFRPINKRYVPKFMFYQLNYRTFHNHIELEKSGTTFFGITQEAVGKYNAFLPSIAEQTAIVEILSDMDAEIRAVEEKLSKARGVKAGMMSALLTGRVRLM